jgi:hypothetical protein
LDQAATIEKLDNADIAKIDGVLKLILAAKEIQGIDIEQVGKVLSMVQVQDQMQQAKILASQQVPQAGSQMLQQTQQGQQPQQPQVNNAM